MASPIDIPLNAPGPPVDGQLGELLKRARQDMQNCGDNYLLKLQTLRAYALACGASLAVDAAQAWEQAEDTWEDETQGERGDILADAAKGAYQAAADTQNVCEVAHGCLRSLYGDDGDA